MKEKTKFENDTNLLKNDITPPEIVKSGDPGDFIHPDRENKTWCSYMENGFRESRIIIDAQSGANADDSGKFTEEKISIEKI